MYKLRVNFCLYLLLIFSSGILFTQEIPPIITYTPDSYRAGNQNWMIAQDEDQFIYAANNEGLITYNGQNWTQHSSPNETIIRSVLPYQGKIYTGCYMEFGCWTPDSRGQLQYSSISQQIQDKLVADEQFWNIIPFGEYLIFQSLEQLAFYHTTNGSVNFVSPPDGIFKTFVLGESLYFSDTYHRLFQLAEGKIIDLSGEDRLPSSIIHCWAEDDVIYAQTATDGCYRLIETGFEQVDRYPFLRNKRVYCGRNLRNGELAFGTVSDGLYLIDTDGQLNNHLNQLKGLSNNTILNVFEDNDNNLWLGTDNGINCINVNSPFRQFTDRSGQLGTVYASVIHRGDLYLGSNQGLFVKRHNSEEPLQLVKGTQGQVWSLFVHQDQLFCAHNDGTFLINQRRARHIFTASGTWLFHPIQGQPNLLLQGNYYGVSVLEKRSGSWQFRNHISDFDYSARHLAALTPSELYVSHEYRGIYGLRLDNDFREVIVSKFYEQPEKGKNAGLICFNDQVYYSSREGLFELIDWDNGFQKAPLKVPPFTPSSYSSGKMSVAGGKLWIFNRSSLSFLYPNIINDTLQQQIVPIKNDLLNAKSGYENVTHLQGDTVVIGTTDGYLLLAVDEIRTPKHQLHLTNVNYESYQQGPQFAPLDSLLRIKPRSGPVVLKMAVPNYNKFLQTRFRYRIEGSEKVNWTDWRPMQQLMITGLGYGEYVLEAQSTLGAQLSENIVRFPFKIQRPWYLGLEGIIVLISITALLIYSLHRMYTGYYRRQRRAIRLENEQKIALQKQEAELALSRIKNEQLEQDVVSKNKEMATSMMTLVKKNELLQQIKEILERQRPAKQNIQKVITLIDKSMDESETWSLFQEAFEHTDREFFQQLKTRHPELKPNDLKLCAYLRLNLSSKEIAPLFNISVRSVEVKRYRLRKKLALDREDGLVDYILSI